MLLNKEQELAVTSNERCIFLIAGAGSGKTRVIVERIKRLILNGVDPNEILCITFTNKATDEMKERLKGYDVATHTFHGYCYQVLSSHKTFQVFEYNNEFSPDEVLKVATYKNSLKSGKKPKIYDNYEAYLSARNLLDFDDLMIEAFPYMGNHPFKHIFIDEFQDTNLLQYELLKRMFKEGVHIFAVGDPDQSIYAFRGARVELIGQYIKDYAAKLLKLEMNYRSNPWILEVSNKLIKKNMNRYKKRLIGIKDKSHVPITYIGNKDRLYEEIIHIIKKYKLFDAVILFRNHYQIAYLKQLLKRHYLFNVRFLSFHESKGLEFRAVFIVGLEDLPYDKVNIYKNTEEERRLLFVGMTRAMDYLFMFSTKKTSFIKNTNMKIKYV